MRDISSPDQLHAHKYSPSLDSILGLGVAVLCIGLAFRMVASFLAVFRLGLNYKEMLFIPLAWLPKATVQAAIGSIALDTANAKNAPKEQKDLGIQVSNGPTSSYVI